MLTQRLTEARKAVSLFDPALLDIEDKLVREYAMTRDITKLGDLSKLASPPTVFELEPMLPKYQHLQHDPTLLFAYHVKSVQNGPVTAEDFEPVPGSDDGRKRLSTAGLAKLPHNVASEMGNLVWELACKDGQTTPFSYRASLLVEERNAQKQLRAMNASTEDTAS